MPIYEYLARAAGRSPRCDDGGLTTAAECPHCRRQARGLHDRGLIAHPCRASARWAHATNERRRPPRRRPVHVTNAHGAGCGCWSGKSPSLHQARQERHQKDFPGQPTPGWCRISGCLRAGGCPAFGRMPQGARGGSDQRSKRLDRPVALASAFAAGRRGSSTGYVRACI